jgi:hypothetical protein
VSETLSRHRVHGAALPPTWKASWSIALSTSDVKVYEKCCGSGERMAGRDSRSGHGSVCCCTLASTPTGTDAEASKESS